MKRFLFLPVFFFAIQASAQSNAAWQGKKCAVVLTYDDALNVHLDNAIPLLDSLNLKATFYLTAFSDGSKKRLNDWKKAAAKGHELGNHTLFHPCVGGTGREWVSAETDMRNYTVKRMEDEVRMTNVFLQTLDNKQKRTFAFTCGDMKIGDSPFIQGMKNDFVAARAVRHQMHKINEVDLLNVDCYAVNGETGTQMIEWVKKAMQTNSLLVILFHGVGGEHSINVSSAAHRELLTYLKQNEKDIYIAPMLDVAEHIGNWQVKHNQANRQTTPDNHKSLIQPMEITSARTGPYDNTYYSANNIGFDESISELSQEKGLKDYYKNYFTMGVAVSPRALKTDEAQLILQQFGSMTPENAMKMGPIHPQENEYNWAGADSIAAFALRNNLKLRGHTLVWHSQTPRWLFVDSAGKTVTKEVLLQRLKDHIFTVVKRYKGTIYAWDVVNEAISDSKDEFYRNSPLYKICGDEFIRKAFEWAHEADPNALLFYNDYNEINPVKREKMFKLVKDLKDAGVPIHGVGLQGHWALNEPSEQQLDSTLFRFGQLGVKVHITELDISVYPKEHNARTRQAADSMAIFTEEREKKQMEVYNMCFRLFRKHKNSISAITFWNISDRSSWLDNFPVRGRKDYPLLFDKDLKPKKAFWEVVRF